MIIVFDLDDTLYEEITYVKSGFRAVAVHLKNQYPSLRNNDIYEDLINVLHKEGRGRVFNIVLDKYGIFDRKSLRKCLSIYRLHTPSIQLSKSGLACLERFSNYPLYLVTDGNKIVQTKKIQSLGLDKYFKKTLPTHRFGIDHAKPSTYCFHKILEWEKAKTSDLVYIGDNPRKDFVNLKKEGFRTIRVLTGEHKNLEMPIEYNAELTIESLDELTLSKMNKLFSN